MTYIIAEIGNAHEGEYKKAEELIHLAAEAGADACKFQMFIAETLVHKHLKARVGSGMQVDRMKSLEFDAYHWELIIQACRNAGVDFVASIFDKRFLKYAKHMSFVKIASGDATEGILLRECYKADRPMLISCGLATEEDINRLGGLNKDRVTFMHCVSQYPTAPEDAALERIGWFLERYGKVGYSDHTCGIDACLAAVAMGATIIEKHFTDETRGGSTFADSPKGRPPEGDHIHAATPDEMSELVSRIRHIDLMLGPWYIPGHNERKPLERGGYATRAIRRGETIGHADVIALRPRVKRYAWTIPGSAATRDYAEGECFDD